MMALWIWGVGVVGSCTICIAAIHSRAIPGNLPHNKILSALLLWPLAMARMLIGNFRWKRTRSIPANQLWKLMLCDYFQLEMVKLFNQKGASTYIGANLYKNDQFWGNDIHVLETIDRGGTILLLPDGKIKRQHDDDEGIVCRWSAVTSDTHKVWGGEVETYQGEELPNRSHMVKTNADPYEESNVDQYDPY